MSLRALFFDVGGTLLTEVPTRYDIYAEVAQSHGRTITSRSMERIMRNAHEEVPRRISGAFRYSDGWFRAFIHRIFCQNLGLTPAETQEIAGELFERFEDAKTFRVFDGARELLGELKERGLTLGVISNWSERLPKVLAATELDGFFDVVVCSAIEESEKPDATIFATALERAGVDAADALHIGDHPTNDGGAREVGMDFLLIDNRGKLNGSDSPALDGFEALGRELRARLDA